jgi:hypothetical protein
MAEFGFFAGQDSSCLAGLKDGPVFSIYLDRPIRVEN